MDDDDIDALPSRDPRVPPPIRRVPPKPPAPVRPGMVLVGVTVVGGVILALSWPRPEPAHAREVTPLDPAVAEVVDAVAPDLEPVEETADVGSPSPEGVDVGEAAPEPVDAPERSTRRSRTMTRSTAAADDEPAALPEEAPAAGAQESEDERAAEPTEGRPRRSVRRSWWR